MSKVRLKDVREAETNYQRALMRYGENNMETIRCQSVYYNLRDQWNDQKRKGRARNG